jgi:hypothetical protein
MITKARPLLLIYSLFQRRGLAYEVILLFVLSPLMKFGIYIYIYISNHLSPSQWHIHKIYVSMCMCIPPHEGTQ